MEVRFGFEKENGIVVGVYEDKIFEKIKELAAE